MDELDRDTSVCVVTRLRARIPGFDSRKGHGLLSSHLFQTGSPPSLLSNWYWELFPRG
jgi:hypothetical protein